MKPDRGAAGRRDTAGPSRHHAPPANVVDVRWRVSDLAPATAPGEICVPISSIGRVCARYPTGERPADALTARLRAQGIAVR